jgi:hypothetical protein
MEPAVKRRRPGVGTGGSDTGLPGADNQAAVTTVTITGWDAANKVIVQRTDRCAYAPMLTRPSKIVEGLKVIA